MLTYLEKSAAICNYYGGYIVQLFFFFSECITRREYMGFFLESIYLFFQNVSVEETDQAFISYL